MTTSQAIVVGLGGSGAAVYTAWLRGLAKRGRHEHIPITEPRIESEYITIDSEHPGLL